MILNINQIVTVTLTEDGRAHYRAHLLNVLRTLKEAQKDKILRDELPGDDGKVQMELWRVFDVFGQSLNGKILIMGGNLEVPELPRRRGQNQ